MVDLVAEGDSLVPFFKRCLTPPRLSPNDFPSKGILRLPAVTPAMTLRYQTFSHTTPPLSAYPLLTPSHSPLQTNHPYPSPCRKLTPYPPSPPPPLPPHLPSALPRPPSLVLAAHKPVALLDLRHSKREWSVYSAIYPLPGGLSPRQHIGFPFVTVFFSRGRQSPLRHFGRRSPFFLFLIRHKPNQNGAQRKHPVPS